MAMVLQIGSYSFASDTVAVGIDRNTSLNEAMECYVITHRWDIAGQIHGDDQNTVIANMAALELACSVAGKDIRLYGNDGTTVAHALLNAGSVSGVRITKPPSYPKGDGAELTTFRTFTMAAEADYFFAPQKLNQLKAFSETVNIQSGGPVYDLIEMVNGPPIFYRVRNFSPWRASQSGQAIGLHSRPTPPPPLWPGALMRGPSTSKQSPRWMGKRFVDFGVSWQYEFASAEPLVGEPGLWPTGA